MFNLQTYTVKSELTSYLHDYRNKSSKKLLMKILRPVEKCNTLHFALLDLKVLSRV